MASTIEPTRTDEVFQLLRSSRWEDAVSYYERELSAEEQADPAFRLPYAVALIRVGRIVDGISRIDSATLATPNGPLYLRRFVLAHLADTGAFDPLLRILDMMIAANPDSLDEVRLRGSIRGRLRRFDDAILDARSITERRPDDLAGHTALLQLLVQAGYLEQAGLHARGLSTKAGHSKRLAVIVLIALERSGRLDDAADVAAQLTDTDILDPDLAATVVRLLFEDGRLDTAISVGERFIDQGWDHASTRWILGQAALASSSEDRQDLAMAHFRAGLALNPSHVRMNGQLGEMLLRTRNYAEAIPYLAKVCELQPETAQARVLYARALKQTGRYADAAVEFKRLLEMQPSSPRWPRYAAGALAQAGQRKEASALFDRFVTERRRALPHNFERGLDALWDRVDEAEIPQARLDWAWSLHRGGMNDRAEWERRAKWGHLADHYLLDWLECRDDRIPDAMSRLSDLSEAERALGAIDKSKGMILASCHIGPMYAGPLALELMGIRSRWLASTPSVAKTAYAKSLISTSDQDDLQVARSFMISIRQGYSVVIGVDGAINLAAPRIVFEGQEMTYSSFAARTAQRLEVPSVFCAPRWEGGRIGFVIEQMPDAELNEDPDVFAERWREAFLTSLRDFLGGAPENLRLSGGLWRHVR